MTLQNAALGVLPTGFPVWCSESIAVNGECFGKSQRLIQSADIAVRDCHHCVLWGGPGRIKFLRLAGNEWRWAGPSSKGGRRRISPSNDANRRTLRCSAPASLSP